MSISTTTLLRVSRTVDEYSLFSLHPGYVIMKNATTKKQLAQDRNITSSTVVLDVFWSIEAISYGRFIYSNTIVTAVRTSSTYQWYHAKLVTHSILIFSFSECCFLSWYLLGMWISREPITEANTYYTRTLSSISNTPTFLTRISIIMILKNINCTVSFISVFLCIVLGFVIIFWWLHCKH